MKRPKCPKCGSLVLLRDITKINASWAKKRTEEIRRITQGQRVVYERLCPNCHQDLVADFTNNMRVDPKESPMEVPTGKKPK